MGIDPIDMHFGMDIASAIAAGSFVLLAASRVASGGGATFAYLWLSIAAPLWWLPIWAYRSSAGRTWLAIALAALAIAVPLARRARAVTSNGRRSVYKLTWWLATASLWSWFWLLDLRHARVQLVLFGLPVAAAVVALVLAWAWRKRPRRQLVGAAACAAALAALAHVWVIFALRADNGCTGVSDVYGWTLLLSAPLLFALGPVVSLLHLEPHRATVMRARCRDLR